MQHVPEQYPMILFMEKTAHDEMVSYLLDGGYHVVKPTEIRQQYEDAVLSGNDKKQIVVYNTENFDYEADGIATIKEHLLIYIFQLLEMDIHCLCKSWCVYIRIQLDWEILIKRK